MSAIAPPPVLPSEPLRQDLHAAELAIERMTRSRHWLRGRGLRAAFDLVLIGASLAGLVLVGFKSSRALRIRRR